MATDEQAAAGRSEFATTHWSMVLAAGNRRRPDASRALAQLCETYWYPLYAYVRRSVGDVHEAQDFTQAFFERLLELRPFETVDPERGRFRAFLLSACKRFLINEWHKGRAAKRGGGRRTLSLDFASGESKLGLVAVDTVTAEQLFEQEWAVTLLDHVLNLLRAEYVAKDRLPHFEALKHFLAGASRQDGYHDAARVLGMSETTAKVAAHRMKKRYRELLRAEIGQTVERPEDVEDEIRDLFAVLGTCGRGL
jgi:DNA-directed RNA polymerase specialized sigma24 family protein